MEVHRLKKPSAVLVKTVIESAAKKEKLTLESAGAELIALVSDGSFRDAYGALQKVVSAGGGKKLTLSLVEEILGAPRSAVVMDVVSGIAEKNADRALKAVRVAEGQSVDASFFLELVITKIRQILLSRYSKDFASHLDSEVSAEEATLIKALSSEKSAGISSDTLKTLLEASLATRRSPIPFLPLEIAVMELTNK